MKATVESLDFKPPQAGRWSMPLGLAFITHGLLIAALTWGVHWQQDPQPVAFEAELWSPTVSRAAPAAVQPPPPPPEPTVQPEPRQTPQPKPEPKAKPEPRPEPPAPPKVKAADIAIEQAKKEKQRQERQRQVELAQENKAKAAEQAKREKAETEKKLAADKQEKEEAKQKRLAEAKAKKAAEADARAEKELLAQRDANLKHIQSQARATGGPTATGSAQRDSGPSAGYGGRVIARMRPNIIYQADFPPSLMTDVEVRSSPDGNITSRRVVRSSGNREWDEQALRAVDRMGVMPQDTNGIAPPVFTIGIQPRD